MFFDVAKALNKSIDSIFCYYFFLYSRCSSVRVNDVIVPTYEFRARKSWFMVWTSFCTRTHFISRKMETKEKRSEDFFC